MSTTLSRTDFPGRIDSGTEQPTIPLGRILIVPPSGGWKAARTRTLESVRYVAQPFQAAGSRSFPAPRRSPICRGPWWVYQDAPAAGREASLGWLGGDFMHNV